MTFISKRALPALQLILAAAALCFSSASFAQQTMQADASLNSEMGGLLMVLALVLAFAVVARRAPHDGSHMSNPEQAANVKAEPGKPSGTILHMPERTTTHAPDPDLDGDPTGTPPSRIAS